MRIDLLIAFILVLILGAVLGFIFALMLSICEADDIHEDTD